MASQEDSRTMERDSRPQIRSSFFTKILSRLTEGRDEEDRNAQGEVFEINEVAVNYYCSNLVKIIIPVFICMVSVSILVSHVAFFSEKSDEYIIYTPLNEDHATSTGQRIGFAVGNMLIMVSFVVVVTFLFVLLFVYGCYKVIRAWLIIGTLDVCFMISTFTLMKTLESYNLPLDYFTLCIVIWNFGVVGTISIHWKAPLILQQFYLIFTCAVTASVLVKYLAPWTTWTVLVGMAVYDIFAVLCPYGPLRMLINVVDTRSEPFPAALIYSSEADHEPAPTRRRRPQEARRDDETLLISNSEDMVSVCSNPPSETPQPVESEPEEEPLRGMKLGLGDFVFYSLLVARVTLNGDTTAVAFCVLSITAGLVATIIILAIFRTSLPALPFSILFGVIAYFTQSLLMFDFYDFVSRKNIVL